MSKLLSPARAPRLHEAAPIAKEVDAAGPPAREWTTETFEAAIKPLTPRIYRLCLALCGSADVAEDLAQVSLVRAYLHRESYAGTGSFFGWIAQIVRREYLELRRGESRRRRLFSGAVEHLTLFLEDLMGAPPADPEIWVCSNDSAALLLECIQSIPEPYRMVLALCDIEELSYAEVSEALAIPLGTVKSRHARGRKYLRAAYEERAGKEVTP